ncbi:hypothetical protein ACMFDT_27535 (plasmid) [Escherichia coli]
MEQEKSLNEKYLEERLSDQQDYYAKADALRSNWNAGLQEGLTNWADSATDYASQAQMLSFPLWTGWYQIFPMHWPEMLWTGETGEFNSPGSFKNSDERCHR